MTEVFENSKTLTCSMSKSSKMRSGDLPPSSSVTGRTCLADPSRIATPVGTEPVNVLKI